MIYIEFCKNISIHPPFIILSIHLSIYLSIHLFIHPFIYLSILSYIIQLTYINKVILSIYSSLHNLPHSSLHISTPLITPYIYSTHHSIYLPHSSLHISTHSSLHISTPLITHMHRKGLQSYRYHCQAWCRRWDIPPADWGKCPTSPRSLWRLVEEHCPHPSPSPRTHLLSR